MSKIKILIVITMCYMMQSCIVAKNKYDQQVLLAQKYKNDKEVKEIELASQIKLTDTANAQLLDQKNTSAVLAVDTVVKGKRIKELLKLNDELHGLYKGLSSEKEDIDKYALKQKDYYSKQISTKEKTIQTLQAQLEEMHKKIQNIDDNRNSMDVTLKEREQRIQDLERVMNAQDSILKSVKKMFTKAFDQYKDSLFTVKEKDGKIYLVIADALLFQSGKTEVNKDGVVMLTKLSKHLEKIKDFDINIEGHTDSLPYMGKNGIINDNWDLSVLRATNVHKIITTSAHLDQQRVIPSGRADLQPIQSNSTPQGRNKNRRIEIILTPDYYKMLQNLTP
jgi:chemotaxis protein MotB